MPTSESYKKLAVLGDARPFANNIGIRVIFPTAPTPTTHGAHASQSRRLRTDWHGRPVPG